MVAATFVVGNTLATRETSVATRLLCMFKRELATDFSRRSVGNFTKPFCDLSLQPLRDYHWL